MSICKFGKQASGNLPIMLVTLGSLSRPFAYRMAPRLKQERCFQQSNCKEITSLFRKFTPKDPNRRANSLALFFVPLLLEGQALITLSELYETRGITAFRLDNKEERQRTVDACLSVSLQHLETF